MGRKKREKESVGSMSKDDPILGRMRASQIPPFAYTTTLKLEKQSNFAQIIEGKQFDTGPSGIVSYLVKYGARKRPGSPSVTRVCAVAARELVLLRRKVYYTTIHELALALSMYERGLDCIFPLVERLGLGYIVIGDIGENIQARSAASWHDIQTFLNAHLSRGGGLILGLTAIEHALFTHDLAEAVGAFQTVTVE